MFRNFLLVGAGGAAGSMLRYGIGAVMNKYIQNPFPFGTFTVNIVGSLLIGLFFGLTSREAMSGNTYLILASGFCGGFTTFSTFALDNVGLMQKGLSVTSILYIGFTLILGLLLCRVGLWLAS